MIIGPSKTKAAMRSVPIPKQVRRGLSAQLEEFVPANETFVFAAVQGGCAAQRLQEPLWAPAVKESASPLSASTSFRHTAISL